MSRKIELFAITRLIATKPGMQKNGLQKLVKMIPSIKGEKHFENLKVDFIPDGTRLRRQPAFNPDYEPYDITLEIWEIEDSHQLNEEKMLQIAMFAQDLFDVHEFFTEVFVCDRYGMGERKVFDVRNNIVGMDETIDANPKEYYVDGEWVSSIRHKTKVENHPKFGRIEVAA